MATTATEVESKVQNLETEPKHIKTFTAVPPTVRLMNYYVIDTCAIARPKPLTDEALKIYSTATASSSKSKQKSNQS